MVDSVIDFGDLNEAEKAISELILQQPAPGKHAARSAISHIQRAWKLRELDPEMAVFRAITGEEEAARAIFHALQRHRYSHADQLNWRDHRHKGAVLPFISAVGRLVMEIGFASPKVEIREVNGSKQIVVELVLRFPDGRVQRWIPNPPLNLVVLIDDKIHDFGSEIAKVANEENFSSIKKCVADTANQRNLLLYASNSGVPKAVGSVDEILRTKRTNIFTLLALFLLIDKYTQQQAFVSQALRGFLQMIERLPTQ